MKASTFTVNARLKHSVSNVENKAHFYIFHLKSYLIIIPLKNKSFEPLLNTYILLKKNL